MKEKFPNEFDLDDVFNAVHFNLEYCKQNMFLDGQIQHWITLTNLSKLALKHLPKKEMQKIINCLSENYMFCLGKSFHVNCTMI